MISELVVLFWGGSTVRKHVTEGRKDLRDPKTIQKGSDGSRNDNLPTRSEVFDRSSIRPNRVSFDPLNNNTALILQPYVSVSIFYGSCCSLW